MADERKDSWGRWGIVLPLAIMVFGSSLFAVVENLLLGLQMGFSHPKHYLIVSIYSGLTLVAPIYGDRAVRPTQSLQLTPAKRPVPDLG